MFLTFNMVFYCLSLCFENNYQVPNGGELMYSVFKFLQLMTSSDTMTINNLSYFIYNAFKMRNSRLQNA